MVDHSGTSKVDLAMRLRLIHAHKKLARNGIHGQVVGMESYFLTMPGSEWETLMEAADEIERLRRIMAMIVEMPASTHAIDQDLCREALAGPETSAPHGSSVSASPEPTP